MPGHAWGVVGFLNIWTYTPDACPAHETVSQLFFDNRILENIKKARESFWDWHIDMIEYF
jgi:hypothetical protein